MKDATKRRLWCGLALLSVLTGLWVQRRLLPAASRLEPLSPREVEQKRANGAAIIDVREPVEFGRGHIPGAISIPLSQIARRWQEVPKDRERVLICQHGPRALAAALILRRRGLGGSAMLSGGMSHWHGPVEV